jgi:hypothetical protein
MAWLWLWLWGVGAMFQYVQQPTGAGSAGPGRSWSKSYRFETPKPHSLHGKPPIPHRGVCIARAACFLSCTSDFLCPFASNYVYHRVVLLSSSAAHMLGEL